MRSIIRLFRSIWNVMCGKDVDDDDSLVIHHVGLTKVSKDEQLRRDKLTTEQKAARDAAMVRHGKPFHTDSVKQRETDHSRDLIDLINASESAKTKQERDEMAKRILNIRQINRGNR